MTTHVLIEIDYPVDDVQGMKELIAMRMEDLGRGVRVAEVWEDEMKQESLFRKKEKA